MSSKRSYCRPLTGRRVLLYPDLNASAKWLSQASLITKDIIDIDFIIDNKTVESATDEEREQGWDTGDYLLKWRGYWLFLLLLVYL